MTRDPDVFIHAEQDDLGTYAYVVHWQHYKPCRFRRYSLGYSVLTAALRWRFMVVKKSRELPNGGWTDVIHEFHHSSDMARAIEFMCSEPDHFGGTPAKHKRPVA